MKKIFYAIFIYLIGISSAFSLDKIKIVTPAPAPSLFDIFARVFAKEMSDDNTTYYIEHKPGASGDIALNQILLDEKNNIPSIYFGGTAPFTINRITNDIKLNELDFQIVTPVLDSPWHLVSHIEFDQLKNEPRLLAGTNGNVSEMQIKILSKYLNKQIEIIPYKTNGEVVSALLRKEVHISILGNVSSNLTDNGVKVIGTSFKSNNYFDLSTIIPDFKYFKAQIGFIVTLKNKQYADTLEKKIRESLSKPEINKLLEQYSLVASDKNKTEMYNELTIIKQKMLENL